MASGVEGYVRPGIKRRLLDGDEPEWMKKHKRRGYIVAAILSCPFWVRRGAFRELRAKAQALTKQTGEPWVLDHIVPLRHPYVCGLTVPANLRVVPDRVNQAKGNDWNPHQAELYFHPQLTLFY